MTPLEVLKFADAILAHPENWTQGQAAKDKFGNPANLYGAEACSFCILGALHLSKYGPYAVVDEVIPRLDLPDSLPRTHFGVAAFNDDVSRSFKDVKDMLRRSIENLEAITA